MHQDLKWMFWWPGIRGEIARFVEACLTCQKAKAERRCPPRELQTMEIPEWKWDCVTMNFVSHLSKMVKNHDAKGDWEDMLPLVEFTYNNSYYSSIGMSPFEALYGRKCRTLVCWFQDRVHLMVGLEMLQKTMEEVELIQKRLRVTYNSQKSYADRHRRPLEFEVGDHVGLVAYKLALPAQLVGLHNVFHISQLRKYVPDPTHVIEPDAVQIRDDLSIELPAA
ncbi:uncharacterized protein LOC113852266 [Abrus precatorius]|uniref:Uncharacterized protein LOC113852266 n=1 Tax=Abrus precatorius TaxID=3816 RepID=A0A8B8K3S1_ABRPR|nr:uncharacterized protein LOC113852266 [Abrus precatorius]